MHDLNDLDDRIVLNVHDVERGRSKSKRYRKSAMRSYCSRSSYRSRFVNENENDHAQHNLRNRLSGYLESANDDQLGATGNLRSVIVNPYEKFNLKVLSSNEQTTELDVELRRFAQME